MEWSWCPTLGSELSIPALQKAGAWVPHWNRPHWNSSRFVKSWRCPSGCVHRKEAYRKSTCGDSLCPTAGWVLRCLFSRRVQGTEGKSGKGKAAKQSAICCRTDPSFLCIGKFIGSADELPRIINCNSLTSSDLSIQTNKNQYFAWYLFHEHLEK